MGSVTYTNWSVYDELRLSYVDTSARGGSDITESGDDVRRRDLVQPLEFEDSYRFGVGASYAWDDRLTLRTGASFDQSPLRNSDFRTRGGRITTAISSAWGPATNGGTTCQLIWPTPGFESLKVM